MKVALAQINPTLGDFENNIGKIIQFCHEAHESGADLVVFPEMATFGYMPVDLLERRALVAQQLKLIKKSLKEIPKDLGVLFGAVIPSSVSREYFYNGAVLAHKGKIVKEFYKELLPNYDVFDEKRFFVGGKIKDNIFKFKNKRVLFTICEDLWADYNESYFENPLDKVKGKIDFVINISGSPYTKTKFKTRKKIVKGVSERFKCPVCYVNLVGAQDEIVFDGGSFAVNEKGKITTQLSFFHEEVSLIGKHKIKPPSEKAKIFEALKTGIRDYVSKTGFDKVHLGLSGGIDSGLVAVLAKEALGSENVKTYFLPGPFTSELSKELAEALAKKLNIELISFDINNLYTEFTSGFEKIFGQQSFGLMNENLQARLRALFLMAISNKESSLLLATSNKSELCVGYSTLYGDQCGALMPLGDLLKNEVYDLCRFYNEVCGKEIVPESMIERPPTAELKANQKDSDSLPDYDVLDASVDRLINKKSKINGDIDSWVLEKSFRSEFKRWQAPPILKISDHAFGRGRRMPLAHRASPL